MFQWYKFAIKCKVSRVLTTGFRVVVFVGEGCKSRSVFATLYPRLESRFMVVFCYHGNCWVSHDYLMQTICIFTYPRLFGKIICVTSSLNQSIIVKQFVNHPLKQKEFNSHHLKLTEWKCFTHLTRRQQALGKSKMANDRATEAIFTPTLPCHGEELSLPETAFDALQFQDSQNQSGAVSTLLHAQLKTQELRKLFVSGSMIPFRI